MFALAEGNKTIIPMMVSNKTKISNRFLGYVV